MTFIIITIISTHLYNAILLRYRVEIIILSCLIDLNFPLPIGIYHLTLQFSENHLTIHSRENRKQSNDGRLENVLRFQSPIFRIHTCIRIRPFLSNDGKLHVWRRQGFSQQHDYNFFSPERDELWTIEFGQYRGWLSICDRQVKLLPDGNSFESKSNRFDCFASHIILTFFNR